MEETLKRFVNSKVLSQYKGWKEELLHKYLLNQCSFRLLLCSTSVSATRSCLGGISSSHRVHGATEVKKLTARGPRGHLSGAPLISQLPYLQPKGAEPTEKFPQVYIPQRYYRGLQPAVFLQGPPTEKQMNTPRAQQSPWMHWQQ